MLFDNIDTVVTLL